MKINKLLSLLFLIVCTIAFNSCEKKSSSDNERELSLIEKNNIENVKKAYELFSSHDTLMFEFFAEDIIEKQEPEPIIGKKALSEFNKAFWKGFTDVRVDLDHIYAASDYTFSSGHLRGTNDGEFPPMGLSKTGKKVDVDFVETIKWKDGKAVLSVPIMNEEKLMQQLGLVH